MHHRRTIRVVILRQPDHDALLEFVRSSAALPRPPIVVNAGSGPSEHPTQSLIDVATLHRRGILDPVGGPKQIVFVGDLQRSRTVNSLLDVLLGWRHLTFVFVPIAGLGPSGAGCKPESWADLRSLPRVGRSVDRRGCGVSPALQDEYGGGDAQKHEEELESLRLTPNRMARLPEHAVVLHRCPVDVRSTPPPTTTPSWLVETVRHGRFVRTALLEACNQNHPHKRSFSLGTAETSAFHEAPSEACRCLACPIRLTTDPRPRLHTPESIRRANAAPDRASCRRTPLFLNPRCALQRQRLPAAGPFGVLWWHGRWAC